MNAKRLLVSFSIFWFCSFSSVCLADVLFESEPGYDPFRDTGDPSSSYNLITMIKHEKVHTAPINHQPKSEKYIVVNPRTHRWSALTADGRVIHSGLATAGSSWCDDLGHPCRTKTGTFRIMSLGDSDCVSKKFPLGEGGAPMPYCMYFNGGQALHGSHELAYANISHGCVRMSVSDARWIRFHFAEIGTKVIIKPY